MKWWNKSNLQLLYFEYEEEGSAKINRMWNRILQSITTFLSAGGGFVEQMCRDFCRERKKNLDKHKRKAGSTEGCLERGWVEKDSATPLKLSPANQSLGHYLLMFFYLAQGTKYLREASQQKAFYPSVYQVRLQSKMKSSQIPNILRSFYLWFWCVTHSLHTDCRFLFSPMDINRTTGFMNYVTINSEINYVCTPYRKAYRNILRLPVKLKDGFFLNFIFYLKAIYIQN